MAFMSVRAEAADLAAPRAPAARPPAFVVFGGGSVSRDSYFGDLGLVAALNGNLDVNGFLFRLRGGVGHYRYDILPGLRNGVDYQVGEAMVGYQIYFGGGARLTGYVGGSIEHHDNADVLAQVRGTKGGVKGQLEFYTPIADRVFFFALGSLSSVYNGYFAAAKIGYQLTDAVTIAPEAIIMGNIRFDQFRAGLSAAVNLGPADVIVSGGYGWGLRNRPAGTRSQDSPYGTVHLRFTF